MAHLDTHGHMWYNGRVGTDWGPPFSRNPSGYKTVKWLASPPIGSYKRGSI